MSACPSILSGVMRIPADQAGQGVENHLEVSLSLTIKTSSLSQIAFPHAKKMFKIDPVLYFTPFKFSDSGACLETCHPLQCLLLKLHFF